MNIEVNLASGCEIRVQKSRQSAENLSFPRINCHSHESGNLNRSLMDPQFRKDDKKR